MKNERGQMAVEMVLMIALSVGVAVFIGQQFRSNEYFASLVSGPWVQVQGLIQNGAWGSPEETMAMHPAQYLRINSVVDNNEAATKSGGL